VWRSPVPVRENARKHCAKLGEDMIHDPFYRAYDAHVSALSRLQDAKHLLSPYQELPGLETIIEALVQRINQFSAMAKIIEGEEAWPTRASKQRTPKIGFDT
jgi:hypothetical protein